MLAVEAAHRAHAIVEQIIADLTNGPLAHLPSGSFAANSAWLVCAAITFNLTRAAGTLASSFHAKATTGTIRVHLINVPARLARSARRLILHLPTAWPWQQAWQQMLAGPTLTSVASATGRAHRPARAPRPVKVLIEHAQGDVRQQRGQDSSNAMANLGRAPRRRHRL